MAPLLAWAADAPPPAPSVPVTEVLHGVTVQDPYRNLENLADPATRQWLLAQGEYTAALLARIVIDDSHLSPWQPSSTDLIAIYS